MAGRSGRPWRHLAASLAGPALDADSLQRVAFAIAGGELRHRGELCFAIEAALPLMAILRGTDARERAQRLFSELRVWDTEANNGVLVYLLLADRRIEIVADRGLDGRVGSGQWADICASMQALLRAGDPEAAAVAGASAVSELMAIHFPRAAHDVDENELPDLPRVF